MENNYDSALLSNKYKLTPEQLILESNILVEAGEEVSKILSHSSRVDLDYPIEILEKECNLSGKLIINLVYLNTAGELNSQTFTSPFVYKISDANFDTNSKLNINVRVVNIEFDKNVGNQIKVISTLNIDGVIIKNVQFEYLKEVGENTFSKQEEKEIVSFKTQICENFEENIQATVKDGVKKVLLNNVDVLVKDWTVGNNFISIEGEIYAKVLYANKSEPTELQTVTITKNFKQEIEVNDISNGCDLDLCVNVKSEGVVVELEEKDSNDTIITVTVPLTACYNTYECHKIMSIVDAYSCQEIVSIKSDQAIEYKNCKPEYLESKVEGNVVLSDNEPRVDKYLCTTNVVSDVSNCYINDGKLLIEGIINADVVYLNDELGAIQSVQIEIPYVIDKKVDIDSEVILEPNVCLFDVDVMVKRGREIYFDAKAKVFINVTCKQEMTMVTKLDSLGTLPVRDNAIEIYFGKAGEYFWDIAKNLKMPIDIIASQNPELVEPLEKDQNIAIYFQKKRNRN